MVSYGKERILCWIIGIFLVECTIGRNSGGEEVEILIWSGGSWAGFLDEEYFKEPNYLGHDVNKTKWNCPVYCKYTKDKDRLGNVDAVIFEAQPITGFFDDYKRNPPQWPQKYSGQFWVNHGYETHIYFNLYGDPGYVKYIDINMTFYLHSQVPITFTCLWGGGKGIEDFLKPPPPKTKDKCIALMASNCGSGGATSRTAYLQEFMSHIHVDSYGKCLHNKDVPKDMDFPIYSNHGASMRNKIAIFKDYKFVLTFENNNITDYVTEKLPCVLQAGSVPIYMGAPNVHPFWTPGENAIIRTDQFEGPQQLAKYLTKLCESDEEYYKYFEWKKKPLSPHFQQRFSDCAFYGAECRLCEYIVKEKKKFSDEKKKAVEKRKSQNHQYKMLQFNGDHQFLRVTSLDLPNFDSEITILFWLHLPQLQDYSPILSMGKEITLAIKKEWKRGYMEFCMQGTCYVSTCPLVENEWHHLGVSFSSKRFVKFYLNGVEDSVTFTPYEPIPDPNTESKPWLIGTTFYQDIFLNGLLDDLSIWNIAFTKEEIEQNVYSVFSGIEKGLIAYWSFNQENTNLIFDTTQHSFHAEFIGNPELKNNPSKTLITVNTCL